MGITDDQLSQLETQQAYTVEVMRNILMGRWDDARVRLDAIDPSRAGQWTNVPFVDGDQ